jgi:hypothetical protein
MCLVYVFEAVTRKEGGAASRVAADSLQSLMSQLVDRGRVRLAKRKSARLDHLPDTVEKQLQVETEDLMQVYDLESKKDP